MYVTIQLISKHDCISIVKNTMSPRHSVKQCVLMWLQYINCVVVGDEKSNHCNKFF